MLNPTTVHPFAMPEPVKGGKVPTLNNYGWMITRSIEPADEFIEFAAKSKDWALDVGCAYGYMTLGALNAGARVVANDIDERHLAILQGQVPPRLEKNLKTVCGGFPDVQLPEAQFGAILANRVLHFLDGPTLERAIHRMHELLVSGGKVFVRVLCVYTQISQTYIPEYERRKAAGEKWPGFVPDVSVNITDELELAALGSKQFHYLEPDQLAELFTNAGFEIERSGFFSVPFEDVRLDGRETCLLIARKR